MRDRIQINFRCTKDLADKLEMACPEGTKSEFICKAILEKLNRKHISMDETYHWLKKIEKLDTESIYRKTSDVEFTSQVIFQEIKKQNEILKLILRRATFASGFSSNVFSKVTNAGQELEKLKDHLCNTIDNDIKQLKL